MRAEVNVPATRRVCRSSEKELRQIIQERTEKQLAGLRDNLGGLGVRGGKLDGVQDRLNAMIKDAGSAGGSKLKLR